MNEYTKNDLWIWDRLKKAWPLIVGVLVLLAWVIAQYYGIIGDNLAQGDAIEELKNNQLVEIEKREELLQEVQFIKAELPAIKESIIGLEKQNNHNTNLLHQIINLLSK